ncbi:hypothetical protein CALCODRAFT_421111, partial [Calocera cornea HHB12733]
QSTLPATVTFIPLILGSDKTHLTNHSGDKTVHPIYISTGAIKKDIRAKISRRAWLLLAFIPTEGFTGMWSSKSEARTVQNLLSKEMWHKCMRHIIQPLVLLATIPRQMVDSCGRILNVVSRIAAWSADIQEQLMIACLANNSCVSCMASVQQF